MNVQIAAPLYKLDNKKNVIHTNIRFMYRVIHVTCLVSLKIIDKVNACFRLKFTFWQA